MPKPFSKTVILMRHAKSDWEPVGGAYPADIDRPLNARGCKDALRIAEWLAENVNEPVTLLVSPARRAQETAAIVASKLPERNCKTEETLYLASAETLEKVADGEAAPCILLVAHNPGMEELVATLAPDIAVAGRFRKLMPTSGVYGFECRDGMLRESAAKLLFHQRPKLLKDECE